jgi:hypothetical protein
MDLHNNFSNRLTTSIVIINYLVEAEISETHISSPTLVKETLFGIGTT